MAFIDDYPFKNILPILTIIDMILIIMISIVHFVFYFLVNESDFGNVFDTFDSSPLFDFSVDINCGSKSHITFHVWEGREETEHHYYNGGTRSRTKIVDKTNIDIINGNYFCYKYISYKTLLYNGQIIKKEEECNEKYPKDCGTIDTLNQHLCIKSNENCPLYDVGIGDKKVSTDYDYNSNARVYYNNNNYNEQNKKIIGKLILNDGQPCYRLNEKLWKIFDYDEAGYEDLKCDLQIFGKFTDDRYDNKGSITYHKLYEDNLSIESQDLLFDDIKDEYVSLYIREFLGIDKTCDEKNNINMEDYEKLTKNQHMEKICLLVEAIILFVIFISIPLLSYADTRVGSPDIFVIMYIIIIFSFPTIFVCAICQSVFLGRIIANDLSYDCSDDTTNEVLRKENENTKKSMIYTATNLGLDLFLIFINIFSILICYIINKCREIDFPSCIEKCREMELCLCSCSCNCFKKKVINRYNSPKNRYNSNKDGNSNPQTEVVVVNRKQDNPDNRNGQIPENNLGAPPFVYPENNSNANL